MYRPVHILGLAIGVPLVGLLAASAAGQSILYVDDDASTNGNGLTWDTAYKHLQDALVASTNGCEIHVAGGLYYADLDEGGLIVPGDRQATFQLENGVAVRGGYRGLAGGGDPDDRDIDAFQATLNGDIGTSWVDTDNSFHVVTGTGSDATAVLEGFTVTAGQADGGATHDDGAGMYNNGGSPTVVDCTFRFNVAYDAGGGMYNENGSPMVIDCTFEWNWAYSYGGGMHNYLGSPNLTGCTFIWNWAYDRGGGVYNSHCAPAFADCAFIDNWADHGGGMRNYHSTSMLANCMFGGNWASGYT